MRCGTRASISPAFRVVLREGSIQSRLPSSAASLVFTEQRSDKFQLLQALHGTLRHGTQTADANAVDE